MSLGTRPLLLIGVLVTGIVVALVGVAVDAALAIAIGLAVSVLGVGGLALHLIDVERRRHERVEGELGGRASFLEALLESVTRVTATLDPDAILSRTRDEAERLFDAKATLLGPGESRQTAPAEQAILVPLRGRNEELGALHLVRRRPFTRDDVSGATVLAEFAVRATENAHLFAEATVREAERARLSDQVLTAEQNERRRLALFLHDTAVQSFSGVALMLDGGLQAVEAGDLEQGTTVIRGALKRHRSTIGSLRDLSFNLEPVVLRDQGLTPALDALVEHLEREHGLKIELEVDAEDALPEKAQAGLYQIIREALLASIRRGPPSHVEVKVCRAEDGGVETTITDDAPGERRARTYEDIGERARTLDGTLELEAGDDDGTTVRVLLPSYTNEP